MITIKADSRDRSYAGIPLKLLDSNEKRNINYNSNSRGYIVDNLEYCSFVVGILQLDVGHACASNPCCESVIHTHYVAMSALMTFWKVMHVSL